MTLITVLSVLEFSSLNKGSGNVVSVLLSWTATWLDLNLVYISSSQSSSLDVSDCIAELGNGKEEEIALHSSFRLSDLLW